MSTLQPPWKILSDLIAAGNGDAVTQFIETLSPPETAAEPPAPLADRGKILAIEMRRGREAGRADVADDLSLPGPGAAADPRTELREVQVGGEVTVRMAHLDHVPGAAAAASDSGGALAATSRSDSNWRIASSV